MTKADGVAAEAKDDDDVSPSWEELLLAFAVNRHGTAAWDSIASELQKRKISLDAHDCRLKYLDLKRRFFVSNNDDGDKSDGGVEDSAPLLDELRKLRVAQLRREVQRYDLNIESLEMKKKKMEDERERSLKSESADLEKQSEEKRDVELAETGGEPAAGEEMEKDRLSVNESNSTDPGPDKSRAGEKESEPAETTGEELRQSEEPAAELKSEPDPKPPVREDSCNGSSNSIEEEEEANRKGKTEPAEAESDGGEEKENSDVQSSASRSRKKEEEEGGDKVRRGSTTSGDEREHDDQSRAVKELSPAESQPLVDFLQAIRAHKTGSVFQRRLRSQESTKYQKLILQHIDLEIVETRLKEGWYSGSSATKFFRDLLLLVNNALIFFAKNSPESNAASEIRHLISKEISQRNSKSDSSSGKQASLQSLSMSKKETTETPPQSLMLKPRIPGSLIVCRKRSSIAAKASASSSGTDKKKEQTPEEREKDKDSVKKQQHSQPSSDAEEPKITKKRTRDNRISSVPPSTKKNNGKNQSTNNKNSAVEPTKQQGKGGGSSSSQAVVEPNKKGQSTMDSKKRGAANFLNRMKQGSSSNNNGDLLDALKNTPLTGESTSGKGEKKNEASGGKRGGEKRDQAAVTRRGLETRQQVKEKGSPGKRNVGRPPKRGAAAQPPPPPPPAALSKRGRDRGEAETAASKQPKKRTRKL